MEFVYRSTMLSVVKALVFVFLATILFSLFSLSVEAAGCQISFEDGVTGDPLVTNPQIFRSLHIVFSADCAIYNGEGGMAALSLFESGARLTGNYFEDGEGQASSEISVMLEYRQDNGGSLRSVSPFKMNVFSTASLRISLFQYNAATNQNVFISNRAASLEPNPSLAYDDVPGGLVEDLLTRTTGKRCCSGDNQCISSFGTQSSCSSEPEGECKSGRECVGGARLFEEDECKLDGSLGVCASGLACSFTKEADIRRCRRPCVELFGSDPAAEYQCMLGRYNFDLNSEQCTSVSSSCECIAENFVGSYESSFSGGDNSQSLCLIQSEDSFLSGSLFFATAREDICQDGDISCAGIVPKISSATGPASAVVQVGCMPAGTGYKAVLGKTNLNTFTLDKTYSSVDFDVEAGKAVVSLSFPGDFQIEEGRTDIVVFNSQNEVLCSVMIPALPEVVKPPEEEKPSDESTDFGIQNCPYSQVTETGGVNFKPQQGVLAGTAEYDRQRTEHFQCISCIAAGNSWTAIGCVDVSSPEGIFTSLIRLGIGVMGGVALLRMIWLGVVMGRSEEEGKIKEAWQGILATLGGIAAVVFSVLIIRILAVNILNVVPPGFFGL